MASIITRLKKKHGLKVMDALNDLTFEIKPEHIRGCDSKNPVNCASARALMAATGTKLPICFTTATHLLIGDTFIRFINSPALEAHVRNIDKTRNSSPGTFTLLAPKGASRIEEVDKRSRARPLRHQPGKGKLRRKPLRDAFSFQSWWKAAEEMLSSLKKKKTPPKAPR